GKDLPMRIPEYAGFPQSLRDDSYIHHVPPGRIEVSHHGNHLRRIAAASQYLERVEKLLAPPFSLTGEEKRIQIVGLPFVGELVRRLQHEESPQVFAAPGQPPRQLGKLSRIYRGRTDIGGES